MKFCTHGVPDCAYCRWCAEGGEPGAHRVHSEEERAVCRAKIRADWDAQRAALNLKSRRNPR